MLPDTLKYNESLGPQDRDISNLTSSGGRKSLQPLISLPGLPPLVALRLQTSGDRLTFLDMILYHREE